MKKAIVYLIGLVFVLSLLMAACSGTTPTPKTEEPKSVESVVTEEPNPVESVASEEPKSAESMVAEQPAATEEEAVPTDSKPRKSTLKIATDFTLPDGNGNMVSLEDELQENEQVVLVFYIGVNCPLCMAQLSEIENDRARYKEKGAQVIAIAVQDELQASTSAEVSNAHFPILAGDHAVAEAYGVFESTSAGFDLGFGTSTPSVFVIDQDRNIVWSEITHIEGSGCGKDRVPSETILEKLG